MIAKSSLILAIESSCDDTGASVLKDKKVLSNVVANQNIHKEYGGVVPELASRAHQQNIVPVVDAAIKKAKININQLDAIGFSRGPGLLGSLLVGTNFAKSLSTALNIPLIEINHMQAHILAHFIKENTKQPKFPFLCLTVSGGHTQLVIVKNYFEMKIIGQTLDDAAGEAFDKTAKMIGLDYPGGPLIDFYAKKGNPLKFTFSQSNVPNLNFSFSGIKTNVLYFIKEQIINNPNFLKENINDLCSSIQYTIVEMLIKKLKKAVLKYNINEVAIAGGVAANSYFRNKLSEIEKKNKWNIYLPKLEYCTDNAAMIGIATYFKYKQQEFCSPIITANPRLTF